MMGLSGVNETGLGSWSGHKLCSWMAQGEGRLNERGGMGKEVLWPWSGIGLEVVEVVMGLPQRVQRRHGIQGVYLYTPLASMPSEQTHASSGPMYHPHHPMHVVFGQGDSSHSLP